MNPGAPAWQQYATKAAVGINFVIKQCDFTKKNKKKKHVEAKTHEKMRFKKRTGLK